MGVISLTAARQDAWTDQEDNLLAEVVLAHISQGSTQLKAFEETGEKLTRTAAACGFRWNSYVRKQYKKEIELAKSERKRLLKTKEPSAVLQDTMNLNTERPSIVEELMDIQEAVKIFQRLEATISSIEKCRIENEQLKEQNEQIKNENAVLKNEYFSLLTILNKARQMADVYEEKL